MSRNHHESEKEKLRSGAQNSAKVYNSGNSTNNLDIDSVSNAKVVSSAEAEVEQDEDGEDTF